MVFTPLLASTTVGTLNPRSVAVHIMDVSLMICQDVGPYSHPSVNLIIGGGQHRYLNENMSCTQEAQRLPGAAAAAAACCRDVGKAGVEDDSSEDEDSEGGGSQRMDRSALPHLLRYKGRSSSPRTNCTSLRLRRCFPTAR